MFSIDQLPAVRQGRLRQRLPPDLRGGPRARELYARLERGLGRRLIELSARKAHSPQMFQDFAILASIATNPSHPFALLDRLNGLGLRATRSTLYRRVDALVEDGFLAAHVEPGSRGHARRALELTPAGRGELAGSIERLLAKEALESPMFTLALGCAELAGPDELTAILRARMSAAARTLTDEERRQAAADEGEEDSWLGAARERHIAHLKADVAWLQSVLSRRLARPAAAAEERATG